MTQLPPHCRVFVYGASGHGKVVADIMQASHTAVEGFIDDRVPPGSQQILALEVLGNGKWIAIQAKEGPVAVSIGIGDNYARQKVAERCMREGITLLSAVHPKAVVADSAQIGAGVVVMAASVINPDAQICTGAIINTGAIVEHDCYVGDFAHLSPNSAMGGGARLGRLSWLGMGASVIHGVQVGSGTLVGAGAVVVDDLPDAVVAIGVPARVRRHLDGSKTFDGG